MAVRRDTTLDVLLAKLNISGLQTKDTPLYEVIAALIKRLKALDAEIGGISGGGGGSSVVNNITQVNQFLSYEDSVNADDSAVFIGNSNSGDTPPASGDDYVVLSDGGLPTPLPVDDGFGNFIYVTYTP